MGTSVKCILVLSDILSRDPTVQLDGISQIFWTNGLNQACKNRLSPIMEAIQAIPLRGVSNHITYEREFVAIQAILFMTVIIASMWGILRLMCHQGMATECLYNLMSYGIPQSAFPMTTGFWRPSQSPRPRTAFSNSRSSSTNRFNSSC